MKRLLPLLLAALTLGACTAPRPTTGGTGGVNRADQQGKPYIVLVSFDGFRADYLDRYPAPNFQRVVRRGVRAEGLVPVFPSKTFPNHYSIVTGLYAEHHGLVANSFYDPARGESYSISNRDAVMDGSWYRGEPIWVTAERQGMVAASYFWVGSEADVAGVRPTFWKPYDGAVPNEARVDSVLAWLRLPPARRPHVVTLYFSEVDDAGHRHGPDAPELGAAILNVDRALGRLLDGLDALPHGRAVTLVLVSDHGMAAYTPDHAVALETLIDTTGVRVADFGPNANLHVRGGPERARAVRDTLNRRLRHGRAYLRTELPARLHYSADPRIGDVVVVMDVPYLINPRARLPRSGGGTHGWDPAAREMHGLFLAMGPGLKVGATIPAFVNVEIYPFLAETLGLRPAPALDGRAGWLRGQLERD
jgi:predicted AlkP superfamily pyrophosphatase or phosphodiesterase